MRKRRARKHEPFETFPHLVQPMKVVYRWILFTVNPQHPAVSVEHSIRTGGQLQNGGPQRCVGRKAGADGATSNTTGTRALIPTRVGSSRYSTPSTVLTGMDCSHRNHRDANAMVVAIQRIASHMPRQFTDFTAERV